jgi:glutamine amidotransferase
VRVAIVDYGAGNLRSAAKAFEIAGRAVGAVDVVVTSDPDAIARADRVVLPGDGAYADCRAGLAAVPGLDDAIAEVARARGRPFLGICVGMQLLTDRGLEHHVTAGLGWIPGECVPISPADQRLKVPHMGWNTLERAGAHPLLDGLPLGPAGLHAYFLHGFHVRVANPADTIATAEYGGPVTAIVARGNILGMQFHPEKSQRLGLALVERFLRWAP